MRQCFLFEEWRPIPGYDGYYEVSSNGRVRSLDRVRPVRNRHGGTSLRRDKGKVISPCANGNGYVYVSLHRGTGTRQNFYIHRLVAQTFLGKAACRNAEKWDRWKRKGAQRGGDNVFLAMLEEETHGQS